MASPENVNSIFYRFKLPEMRTVWLYWTVFVLVSVAILMFFTNLGASVASLSLLAGFGAFFSYKSYNLAVASLGRNISYGRLESIVTNLEDAVVAYDSNFKILLLNGAAERIFGLKKEEVLGKIMGPELAQDPTLKILVQTLFPSLAPTVVGRSEPNQFPQIVDISFTEPQRELRVSTDRVLDKKGVLLGFVKVIEDRTRERQLIKSKSEFVSVAAHQLRTPLTAITWTLEGLSKNPKLDEADRALAENGLVVVTGLLKTVNDLLNTAEMEEGRFGFKYEVTDLVGFIEKILTNAQVVAKRHGLQIYFDKGDLTELKLMIDPTKLGAAFSNLLDNAMKYNSKNGSVTIGLKVLKDKPYAQVSVQDTGMGVAPADADRIFQKFFRAQNARRIKADGSGLGLYITKNIIEQHGGSIWLESTLGRGTTFYFTLPTDPNLIPKVGMEIN